MNRRELRAALKQQLRAVRATIDANPLVQRERRRRRIRRALISSGLLLLLLFIRCDCGEQQPAETPEPVAEKHEPPPKKVPDAGHPRPGALHGKVDAQPRGGMKPMASGSQPWLDEFRIQVAARSPRLAQCFLGSERPGALRWSASVDPVRGTVSDHELELVGVGLDLDKEQHDCVLGVLTKPVYQLGVADAGGLPDRVSIVIEF